MLTLPLTNAGFQGERRINTGTPFYKIHLENYLGTSYSEEMYDALMDEVSEDVDRRIKELFY